MIPALHHLVDLFKRSGARGAAGHLAAVSRGEVDYKTTWNDEARAGAHEAILTGATAETFESSGQRDADLIGRYLTGGDVVLNIGCGAGRVEKYLAPRVGELWAIDISPEMIRLARERLAGVAGVHLCEVGNREFLGSFPAERFDLVFSLLVLQHLEREDAFLYLRDAHRVLKPGGRLLIQLPNYLSATYTRAFIVGAEKAQRSDGRVRTYTESEVRHTLATAGFEIEDLWFSGHGGRPDEIYVAGVKAR